MDDHAPTPATPPATGGVCFRARGSARPNYLFLCLALLLVAGGAAYLWGEWRAPGTSPGGRDAAGSPDTPAAIEDTASVAGSASAHPATGTPAPTPRDANDLARYVTPGQPAPTMGEVIARLHDAGVHEGLGAFNPPGTSPPLVGLAVPEDFVLPPGYVRHYQATDDGQRIEPILMFSPDYEFFDASGRPITIPENRVVPPELAPPGLPRREIVIPPPLDPRSPPP